jgi:hypothetical protein
MHAASGGCARAELLRRRADGTCVVWAAARRYAEWAHILVPEMAFSDFIERLEKGSNMRVREKLEAIRNVQRAWRGRRTPEGRPA